MQKLHFLANVFANKSLLAFSLSVFFIDDILPFYQFLKDFHLCHFSCLLGLLSIYYDRITVFQCILCPPSKLPYHLGPMFLTSSLKNQLNQHLIFFFSPVPLLYVWIQKTIPMLPTLLATSIHFTILSILIE